MLPYHIMFTMVRSANYWLPGWVWRALLSAKEELYKYTCLHLPAMYNYTSVLQIQSTATVRGEYTLARAFSCNVMFPMNTRCHERRTCASFLHRWTSWSCIRVVWMQLSSRPNVCSPFRLLKCVKINNEFYNDINTSNEKIIITIFKIQKYYLRLHPFRFENILALGAF